MINRLQILIFSGTLLLGQTAEQIKKAKDVIQRTGMSESQAIDAAKSRGFTESQIDAAIQKEKAMKDKTLKPVINSSEEIVPPDLGKSNKVMQEEAVLEVVNEELPNFEQEQLDIISEENLDIYSKEKDVKLDLSYFGYDIFARDPALFQASSVGAVDPDYLIGPGDDIIVMLWGETQFRQVLTVDREGFVFIPEIGQVFVNGLNLNLLESKLFRVFSQSYASLNPQGRTPTTFLDVSLGNLRPLRIQVLGEVAQPGAYTVSPSTTLFSSLYYFNGPTALGSLRDIQLIRNGEKIASIDFYDYLLSGKKPKDQKLQLDDVIFIPRRLKTVSIEGEINRSGIYELKQKENLLDLISMAGDLKVTAYLDRAQIDRIVSFEDREKLGMDRMYTDVNLEEIFKSKDKFPLQDGDRMQVFSIMDLRQNVVDLRGAVSRPGSYDLGDSLKLSELINKADGLLGDAYQERVDIVRIKPDYTEELIKLDLGEAIKGSPENDILLKGSDRVQVYGMVEMAPKRYVKIEGHVKRPGLAPLLDNMTLYDIIFKYGGFVDEKFKNLTYLKRAELIRVIENTGEKEIVPFNLGLVLEKQGLADSLLLPEDAIRVYSVEDIEGATRYVKIEGHVKRPGSYELYEKNMRVSDLLFKAGGFDDPIFKSQTFLERADLIRFNNDRITKSIIPFDLNEILLNKNSEKDLILNPGDEIRVYSDTIFNSIQVVTINGVVRNPGAYDLKTGMTLKDLILEAGGLQANVYRFRVEVARIDPLNDNLEEYAEVITFNIDEKFFPSSSILTNNQSDKYKLLPIHNSFKLKPYDLVSVRPDPYFNNQKQIKITGEVLYPGEYTILSSDEKITDVIDRAGGLLPNAYPEASQYFRQGIRINASLKNILRNPKSKLNFEVQDSDQIIILPHPNVIRITGEVNTSGVHKFVPGKRLRYYLKLAGGVTPDADRRNIWVEYPNRDSKKYNYLSLLSPIVIDGSTITVGKVEQKEPFDRTEFLKETTAIIANLAQAITVVVLATR